MEENHAFPKFKKGEKVHKKIEKLKLLSPWVCSGV